MKETLHPVLFALLVTFSCYFFFRDCFEIFTKWVKVPKNRAKLNIKKLPMANGFGKQIAQFCTLLIGFFCLLFSSIPSLSQIIILDDRSFCRGATSDKSRLYIFPSFDEKSKQ
jgi:hypothetical protein